MRTYPPHQERVFEEKKELDRKIEKLSVFKDGSIFRQLDPSEQGRLDRQIAIMQSYSEVLGERTAAF